MHPILSTVSLNHHPWPEVLEVARASGFTDIELLMIPGWVHLQPDSCTPSAVRAAFGMRDLRLVGIHAGGIDGTSETALQESLSYIRRVIAYAGATGATFVNVNGMPVPPATTPTQRDEMLQRIIRGLGTLEGLARSHGITITLENHRHCHIESLEDYQTIFQAFPLPQHEWLGATIDTGHFTASGIAPERAARELAGRIHHVHIKDHHDGTSVPLGEGDIDNLGCVRALREGGYTRYLSAELELADAGLERRAAVAALPYLQQLITASLELA